ncbi:alpha/beta hydrolase fold domain-containing protein [uncultured Dietzia sp.]|uniref:alpha/beta hydrolase fold domain-containing protein n=1 Tax=uncultured Dietzia sp. TaxID=395519 RepID=UPI0025CEBBFD|nr:alpha/beta hydrolase fold domain-containing protein [uncultured Dietzia sp.]
MDIPEKLIPLYLRATGRQRPFLSEEAAREHLQARALRPAPFGPPRRIGVDVDITVTRRNGWPVYTVVPAGLEPSGSVVYAHGGAWVNEIVRQHWQLIGRIAVEAQTTVVVPIYPLAPVGTAEEVVAGFVDIVRASRERYDDTRLVGDSAGGQIALSAAMELRDRHGITLTRTVLIAPAVDLTWSNPRIADVQPVDPWLAVPGGRFFSETWRAGVDVTDQRVSPIFGEVAGLGPVTVFSGTHDILNPDAHRLVGNLQDAGVEVAFHEGDSLLHVYPLLPTASGRQAREIVTAHLAGV